MSQIHLAQGNFAMCSHCLELGVSHNFQVGAHHTPWPARLLHPFLGGQLPGGGGESHIEAYVSPQEGRAPGSPGEVPGAAV